MMDDGICGFLIVRIPALNYDLQGRGVFSATAPQLGETYYGGIFRMPWFDIEEAYYNRTIEPVVRDTWEQVKAANQDFSGFAVCREFEAAKFLLQYSNRRTVQYEMIAIRSPRLFDLKGRSDFPASSIHWLGHDIVSLGHWSLLREGLFFAPSYFQAWTDRLTVDGLLDNSVSLEGFADDYQMAAKRRAVEELPPPVYGFDRVEIGRLADKAV